ncbi:hypothetical protein HMN09_00028600 [Mycena chlorophos]|uniref:F-box domain-containing protein n=1 Tax=Mycena chlorophos TaxID=658473 RepID=A0A8H6WMD5_MYCCL|nr:hypothetical protein HMN09_00028600 [Mycena chlorophos]
MPKDTSKGIGPDEYLKFYPGTIKRVPAQEQAEILNDPTRLKKWQQDFLSGRATQKRARAEDYISWSLPIPREIMDMILGDEALGVREHLILAATCPELRRLYHSNDIWSVIMNCRTLPINGSPIAPGSVGTFKVHGAQPSPRLQRLATAPQKKKANGAFFKPLEEQYSLHNIARREFFRHRIPRDKVRQLYPLVTDEHLSRMQYYEAFTGGYSSDRRAAGYLESAVEWMSFRIASGLA